MRISFIAAILFALAILSSPASAQRDDQFVWGIGGGATFPSGVAHDNHSTGAHGLVSFGIGSVDSPLGIRFDGMYTSLGNRSGTDVPTDQGAARVFMLTGNGVFRIYGTETRLYSLIGAGGYWYNPNGRGSNAVNDFGVQAGLGLWLPFINGFVEGKIVNLSGAMPDPTTGVKGKKSARLYPVTLGIMF
jgi:hypothetical protein